MIAMCHHPACSPASTIPNAATPPTAAPASYPSDCSAGQNGRSDQHEQVQAAKKVELPHSHGKFISGDCRRLQGRNNVLSVPAGFGLNHALTGNHARRATPSLHTRLSSALPHRITTHLDPMGIVDQPVEDAVS